MKKLSNLMDLKLGWPPAKTLFPQKALFLPQLALHRNLPRLTE
ncbi:hypothetical protein HMPREF1862_00133 [Varibaculum cambriense]|uniref:Uncharacterized protein n=1 Tax=Varibaculum cambriense TaxID=184870 RepID=A0AB34X297_9ACTO|nr:hypothetical protein HMPREF1862_00133 [Varibaculum cambriense]